MLRRAERVSTLIRKEISELLQEQVHDPRLKGFISITEVTTSDDLKNTKVFISILGDETEKDDVLKGFVAATGYFRTQLSKRLLLRQVPELSFHIDNSIERGSKLINLIDKVVAQDAKDEH
jgi:ribosome-binding factor A